jgi:hypothetical protein
MPVPFFTLPLFHNPICHPKTCLSPFSRSLFFRIVTGNKKGIGELEMRLLQLGAPKATESKIIDSTAEGSSETQP